MKNVVLSLLIASAIALVAFGVETRTEQQGEVEAHWGPVAGAVTCGHGTTCFGLGGPIHWCPFAGYNGRVMTWCYQDGPNPPYPADPLWRYYYTWNCGPSSQFGTTQCPTGQDFNWFVWQPFLPYSTTYRVCTHVPPDHAYSVGARYKVFHANGVNQIVVNQQVLSGWLDLGVYNFNAGTSGYLYLGDYTGEPHASTQIGGGATQFVVHGGPCGSGPLPSDVDVDEWADGSDNCPSVHNPGQENNDGDSIGDVCDPDDDNDGMDDGYESGVSCLNKWIHDSNSDHDADGLSSGSERAPYATHPCIADTDGDLLLDGEEVNVSLTLPLIVDTDGDGCADGEEHPLIGLDPTEGGGRDPLITWDFFDVPVPALTSSNPSGTRNKAVGIPDVLAVLYYSGTAADEGPNGVGADYGTDLNQNTTRDGEEYDRTPSLDSNAPWRSGPPNGAVSLQDVLVALVQSGHDCLPPP